jgi:hypothetical protein
MSFFTYVFGKGYTGGPDFNQLETFRFELEDAELSLTLPKTNVAIPIGNIVVNHPFRSPGWFDENCEQMANHFSAHIFTELWGYRGPYWKVMNEPFGVLSCRVEIKRARPEKRLDLGNLNDLAEAIRWDYEWYYEIAEPGKYGQGSNREVRQEAEEEYNSRHPKIPEEKKLRDKEKTLQNLLRELPTKFETRQFGDQEWLYYALKREPSYPAHYYCHPLDEEYYLSIRFGYRIDFRDYFHLWQADAEAAEQRMMGMIKLTYPNRLMGPE